MRKSAYPLAVAAIAVLNGCVEEPTVKDAEKAVTAIEQDEVKKKQLSIEQAAEEATKLIEEDARQEIEASSAGSDSE
jgi:ABC-type uncharacterized transport system auxiliary subunit